jgi:para-nitrobenzyl esterase
MRLLCVGLLSCGLACAIAACGDDDDSGEAQSPNTAAGSGGSGDAGGKAGSAAAGKGGAGGTGGSAVSADGLTVSVEEGKLAGKTNDDSSVRSFLGIPYAKPPVGDLRFKEPQKVEPWKDVREAKDFGGRCAQNASATLMNAASDTEDCLYLNVWTPAPAPKDKLPVMFWIHGGGNQNGSTNEPVPYANAGLFYTGEFLAKHGVVVVSLNYRLGVFGFLAHKGLEAEGSKLGNQGLRDQVFGMEWVKRNVASFGGDPNNVTIFGESAGSLDVCLHVASALTRGLYKGAISESGGCTTFQTTSDTAKTSADAFAQQLGCTGDDALSCLRGKSVADLLAPPASSMTGAPTSSFGPIVDGDYMPDQPRALYDKGDVSKVPYILGSNTDEGTLFTLGLTSVNSMDTYVAALTMRFPGRVDDIMKLYPISDFMDQDNPYLAALSRVFGDSSLVCSTWDAATRFAKTGTDTYMYNFDIPAPIAGLGATHGSELVYVFGTSPSFDEDEKNISGEIQTYWTNFAKKHDPNGGDLLAWPKFSESSDKRINLSLQPSIVDNFRSDKCKYWQGMYDERFAAEQP